MSQDDDAKQEGKWYFDSGCTSHMTGNKDLLSNYREKKGPKIRFGGGVKLSSVGIGDLFLGKLKLADVLYVEGLAYNLLSQGQLCTARSPSPAVSLLPGPLAASLEAAFIRSPTVSSEAASPSLPRNSRRGFQVDLQQSFFLVLIIAFFSPTSSSITCY